MKDKFITPILSLLIAASMLMVAVLLWSSSPYGTLLNRLGKTLGGELPHGLIQGVIYFMFCYAFFEIRRMRSQIRDEEKGLGLQLLPESEQYVLSPDDIAKIKLSMIELERKQKYIIADVIKKACTKFRSSHSISETMEMVSKQASINFRHDDSALSNVRYMAWAIPTMGFVGTVLGIAASMGEATNAVSAAGMQKITSLFSVAFDSTLVALILSLVVMYLYHNIQEKTEKLHTNIEEYVLNNLVNRIYIA